MATLLVWVISQWQLNARIFTTPLCLEISGNICVCLHEYVFVTVTSSSGPWPFNLYLSEPSPPPSTLQPGRGSEEWRPDWRLLQHLTGT